MGWTELLTPYIKNVVIFQCPTDKNDPPPPGFVNDQSRSGYTDYWLSPWVSNEGFTRAVVRYLAMTVLSGDGTGHDLGASFYRLKMWDLNTIPNTAWNLGAATQHLDGANYLFVDGHIKWYKGITRTTTDQLWDMDLTETSTPKIGTVPGFTP